MWGTVIDELLGVSLAFSGVPQIVAHPMHPHPASSAKKIAPQFSEAIYLAEKVGFEPTVMLPPRLISSQPAYA